MATLNHVDQLKALALKLGETLQQNKYQLALAESCTGGMVAQTVTNIAGCSAWFERGFITYSNQAKQEMLGVNAKTLLQFGAVSEQTAIEMAKGALLHSHAHIAASITGIAGPSGGSDEKPVGLVWLAWALQAPNQAKQIVSSQHFFSGNRQQIRQQASTVCLQGLFDLLNQH